MKKENSDNENRQFFRQNKNFPDRPMFAADEITACGKNTAGLPCVSGREIPGGQAG